MFQHWKTFLFGDRQALARGEHSSGRPRILIVRAGAIGDTLMATPLIRAVRRTFPDAQLAFLCSSAARDVLAHNPHLDQLFALAYRHVPSGWSPEKAILVRSLRKLRFDWAVVLESRPSLIDFVSRFRAARLVAYGAAADGPAECASFDSNTHSIENHLRVGQAFLGALPAGLEMELHYPPALRSSMEARLAAAGLQPGDPIVGLHAGWGNRPHALEETRLKSWPPQRFAAVARWLTDTFGARVVLTGSAQDHALNQYIAAHAASPCLNLAGQLSVLETAALIHRMDAYVAIDTGPAHMAAALGTPMVVLLGPAIVQQTKPLSGRDNLRVLHHPVPCAPCYGTPRFKTCHDNICMKQIQISEVQAALADVLAKVKAR